MDPTPRYEIVDAIASGDFATVYRARDRELGREVAVKQIHQQFLADPRQLARYWQEAQLLASLQHPNVVTIYDVVRSRGWLILELMRGSLNQGATGEPIDLDFLRVVLIDCLSALHFLHVNGVIHGDIKPSNMLVDGRNRVKIGDFGLARRASNEGGSLLKGTTKYMAPELVHPQFGEIGAASDLYSLGFSAYELMCGAQFESLFPGLGAFGRDKQIAWMMWHAAADRRLPEISKVLQGVPADLARVIQRMVVKEAAGRYSSAAEALADLRPDPRLANALPEQLDQAAEAARIAAAARKRRLRWLAGALAIASAAVCVAMLLRPEPPKPALKPRDPIRGTVVHVLDELARPKLDVDVKEGGKIVSREISIGREDHVLINDAPAFLRDLQPHDTVEIDEKLEIADGKVKHRFQEVHAFRPKMDRGHVESLKADEGTLVMVVDEGENRKKQLLIRVPAELPIALNGSPELDGKPVRLADLKEKDRIEVHHEADEKGRRAVELSAERLVSVDGVVREIDPQHNKLTISFGPKDDRRMTLPLAAQCEIVLNSQAKVQERLLKLTDLKPGDKVSVAHDVAATKIDAYRLLGQSGVIQRITEKTIEVQREGDAAPTTYTIGPTCKITLGGEEVQLSDLQVGDAAELTNDQPPDAKNPQALSVTAQRRPDNARWAIILGDQDFDDRLLTRLEHAVADAKLVGDVLVKRYRVPTEQALVLTDESLVRLEQAIPDRLAKIGAEAKLIVYVVGHAYLDDKGAVYVAAKNFDAKRPDVTGLGLQWLVDQLEQCPAKEKLLLLDCCQEGEGGDLRREPSSIEMLHTLKGPPGRSPLRTLAAVASCKAGQRGRAAADKAHGLFAACVADGYSGRADANHDGRVETTELFEWLQGAMAAGSDANLAQTPELILPDDRPLRLGDDAKKSIRKLADFLQHAKVNLNAAKDEFATASQAAGKELEPRLLYGLLLIKVNDREAALKHLEELKADNPSLLLPLQGMAWLRFQKRSDEAGVNDLVELVAKIPKPEKPGASYPPQIQQLFTWIGQLREFAAAAEQEGNRPAADRLANLDAAVADRGAEAKRQYEEGRARVRARIARFDRQLESSDDAALIARIKVERHRLAYYAEFPLERWRQEILAGLDRQ